MAKKKTTTLVGFVLDETGSMLSVQQATVSGFNEYVDTLRQKTGNLLFTLVQFNAEKVQTVHRAIPIAQVPPLTHDTYQPMFGTPLYDAVAQMIGDTAREVAAMKDKPSVLIVIMTDGEENASREFSREKLFALIKQKETEGWSFAFLGANQDAWSVGQSIGVGGANSLNYDAAHTGGALRAAAAVTVDYALADDEERDALRASGLFAGKGNVDEYLQSRAGKKSP